MEHPQIKKKKKKFVLLSSQKKKRKKKENLKKKKNCNRAKPMASQIDYRDSKPTDSQKKKKTSVLGSIFYLSLAQEKKKIVIAPNEIHSILSVQIQKTVGLKKCRGFLLRVFESQFSI